MVRSRLFSRSFASLVMFVSMARLLMALREPRIRSKGKKHREDDVAHGESLGAAQSSFNLPDPFVDFVDPARLTLSRFLFRDRARFVEDDLHLLQPRLGEIGRLLFRELVFARYGTLDEFIERFRGGTGRSVLVDISFDFERGGLEEIGVGRERVEVTQDGRDVDGRRDGVA